MKNRIILFLIMVSMLFSLIGCTNGKNGNGNIEESSSKVTSANDSEEKDASNEENTVNNKNKENDMQIFEKVLTDNAQLINMDTGEQIEFSTMISNWKCFINSFVMCDLDEDGEKEVILLMDGENFNSLILRNKDDKIYGYPISHPIAITEDKYVLERTGESEFPNVEKFSFNDDNTLKSDDVIIIYNGVYKVNGEECDADSYYKTITNQLQHTLEEHEYRGNLVSQYIADVGNDELYTGVKIIENTKTDNNVSGTNNSASQNNMVSDSELISFAYQCIPRAMAESVYSNQAYTVQSNGKVTSRSILGDTVEFQVYLEKSHSTKYLNIVIIETSDKIYYSRHYF